MKKVMISAGFVALVVLGTACTRGFDMGNRACTAIFRFYAAQVVDDESGMAVRGAYWRSETLRGEILLELEEELVPERVERYTLVEDTSVIHDRLKEAAKLSVGSDPRSFGSASEDFRAVVAKEGYVTIVRELTATGDICHVQGVEGDTEFRMVKGPPGPDDVFRNPQ